MTKTTAQLLFVSLFLAFLCLIQMVTLKIQNGIVNGSSNIDNMPLIDDCPYSSVAYGGAPVEQRGVEFRKWLSPGVKIRVSGASGSGTIVYYNENDGWAYIQSCGHLWDGNMSAEEGVRRNLTCKVITWYHNNEKLNRTKEYPAEVLYYKNIRGQDCSLLRFKPDWKPNYFPIAPAGYRFNPGTKYHSVGCDGGREIAHYEVEFVGMRNIRETRYYNTMDQDLVTTRNSPRPGRSGGGLFSNDEYYVGICWGTSSYDGSGNGYFTPLETLRDLNKQNGYGWLNDIGHSLARRIPIVDRNNPQGQYSRDYIPLPR